MIICQFSQTFPLYGTSYIHKCTNRSCNAYISICKCTHMHRCTYMLFICIIYTGVSKSKLQKKIDYKTKRLHEGLYKHKIYITACICMRRIFYCSHIQFLHIKFLHSPEKLLYLLNQGWADLWATAYLVFIKWQVGMCTYLSLCALPRLSITSSVMWHDMETVWLIKQVLATTFNGRYNYVACQYHWYA